ncbi:MAG TPA: beta-ketoacyl-ACP synthase II [Spirochaetales bacterium]|nr:beta-ketoacyl-ACP synthase II [Spirochaetales bacterium]
MKTKVAITGLGVVTPIGNDVDSFWNAILAGESGVGPITRFDASRLDSRIAAEVKDFDPSPYIEKKDARKMAPFTLYAVAAAVQAWRQAGMEEAAASGSVDTTRVGIALGNGIGGIDVFVESHLKLIESGPGRMPPMTVPLMIMNEAAGNIAMRLGVTGPALTVATACASGTDALGMGLDLIRSGRCDVVIAGGTEAALTEFAIGAFCMLKALSTKRNDDPKKASRPFDADRDGFVIGEGAGVVILESEAHAKKRGALPLAELAGYGASCDAYHLTAPDPEGKGGRKAIELCLSDAGLKPADVQYYNAHGTSTPINDPTETRMIKEAFGEHARKMKVSSTKGQTGHLVAAAGAVEAIACVLAIRDGVYPPTINLDNPDPECDLDYVPNKAVKGTIDAALSGSLGFGGHNGVVAIRRWA